MNQIKPKQSVSTEASTGSGISAYARPILVGLGVVIATLAVATVVSQIKESKAKVAREAYFVATQAYQDEVKALTPPAPPKAPPSKDGKSKPAEPEQPKPDDVLYKKVDVDQTFPKTVAALKAVVQNHPGSLAAFQAEMMYGNINMDHGAADRAIAHYDTAAKSAPDSLEKMSALFALAEAQESAGHCAEAVSAIDLALLTGVATLKGDLLVTQARCYETLKDNTKAKAVYDRIVMELPNTPFSHIAEMQRAKL